MVIEIDFGQDPPRNETYVVAQDIYATVPEATVLTTKKTKLPDGSVVRQKVPVVIPEHSELVDTVVTVNTTTIRLKRLRLSFYDAPESAPGGRVRRLWFVDVRNGNEFDDLEGYLPLMVVAAMDYLGANFDGERTVIVSREDPRVRFVVEGDDSGSLP